MTAALPGVTARQTRTKSAGGQVGPAWRSKWMDPKRASARLVGYVVLIGLSIISILPLLWMIATSIRPQDTVFGGSLIPTKVTGTAFANAFSQVDIFRNFFNSVEVVGATVIIVLFVATLGGYAFAKLNFKLKTTIYMVLLSTLMLPGATILIPLFLELKQFHLINSKPGLVLVYVATSTPLAVMLMRSFFTRIPAELRDSARVDGAASSRSLAGSWSRWLGQALLPSPFCFSWSHGTSSCSP